MENECTFICHHDYNEERQLQRGLQGIIYENRVTFPSDKFIYGMKIPFDGNKIQIIDIHMCICMHIHICM